MKSRIALAFAAAAALVGASGVARAESRNAVVVLLGDTRDRPDLAAVLSELLQRQDVDVRFERQEKLDTGELLAGKNDRAVRIFVELRGPNEAALYFRSPRARRYLLRRLELRDGLDEVGRELIAQVVASSVDSLLRSSEGMTRSEMRAALARDRAAAAASTPRPQDVAPRAPEKPPVAVAPAAAPAPAARPAGSAPPDATHAAAAAPPATTIAAAARPPARGGGRWNGWVGARYAYSWGGPDLGAGHGPGVEIGLQRQGATQLGARLSAERWFAGSVPTTYVDTDLQISPVCLLLDFGLPLSPTRSFSVGVGGGVNVTRVTPGMVYDPAVAATAPQWNVAPIARGELRYEMGGVTWRVSAVMMADVSIYDTHFDINRGGMTERAATPWRVRPGGALILAWRPTWGG
jgi:hypothetical protein